MFNELTTKQANTVYNDLCYNNKRSVSELYSLLQKLREIELIYTEYPPINASIQAIEKYLNIKCK